jgi:hypothetical protein
VLRGPRRLGLESQARRALADPALAAGDLDLMVPEPPAHKDRVVLEQALAQADLDPAADLDLAAVAPEADLVPTAPDKSLS